MSVVHKHPTDNTWKFGIHKLSSRWMSTTNFKTQPW